MKIIEDISKDIEKEISNAECYAKKALQYKDAYPNVAEHYYKVATQSMANITTNLHPAVTEIIDAYRKEKGDPPEHMKILYDILHKQQIEHLAAVKGMMALYKDI